MAKKHTHHAYQATIAVRASRQAIANSWWRQNIDDTPRAPNTFVHGLSTTPGGSIVAYWCNTQLTREQLAALAVIVAAHPSDVWMLVGLADVDAGDVARIREHLSETANIRILDREYTPQELLDRFNLFRAEDDL